MDKHISDNDQYIMDGLDKYFLTLKTYGYVKYKDEENLFLYIKVSKIIREYSLYLDELVLKKYSNLLYELSCTSCYLGQTTLDAQLNWISEGKIDNTLIYNKNKIIKL